jgi:transcriptional regulator with XRE-family HTH domain
VSTAGHADLVDDRRTGLVLRALRRRRSWRQADLSQEAGLSQSAVSRAELGHLDSLSLRQLRSMFAAVDARVVVEIRWRGGDIDRLIDAGHAQIAVAVATELSRLGWDSLSEVTFMRVGEHGSYDMLAVRPAQRVAAMFEFKTDITSAEETQRQFDAKRRVVASVVEERFGWRPLQIGAFLVVSDTSRNRRRVAALGSILRAALPLSTREVRRWLRSPAGPAGGVWFVRFTHGRGSKCGPRGSHRVRRPRDAE